MALVDLLYRCPRCGHDPMEGEGDRAACPRCATAYQRRGARVEARVEARTSTALRGTATPLPEGWRAGVAPAVLVDAIAGHGGPFTAATRADDSLGYRARALHHGLLEERSVRREGRLLGFAERAGPGRAGGLEATEAALRFRFDEGGEASVLLDQVTALQLASRAFQVGVRGRGTLQWTVVDDSPYRWETLLQSLLLRRWRARGLGEILEFQPRIVTGEAGEGAS